MELHFLGAAREVTGSCHEIVVNGQRVLLDCGMFQGHRQEAYEKNRAFRLRGKDITAVVLSHAHIDHCGNLPQLARSGFHGKVWCTPATRDLARVMLLDAAQIQQRDVEHLARHQGERLEPLYDEDDVNRILARFVAVPYGRSFEPARGVQASFTDAGHIIGSAAVHLEISEPGRERVRLTFTGDLGRRGVPLLRDPAPLPPAELVLTESTYGGREHDDRENPAEGMKKSLESAARLAISHGGRLIIPAFSVGRTQTVLYYLNELVAEGRLPRLPIFIDSPMSTEATAVMRKHLEDLDEETHAKIARAVDPLLNGDVHLVSGVDESKRLNERTGSCVVIAPSGMCEFGRIVHHLAHGLDNPRNVIAFVGYQAEHTLGRRISEGLTPVRVLGRFTEVRATVVKMNAFSAHADHSELLDYLRPLRAGAGRVFVVHGEADQAEALAASLRGEGFRSVDVPAERDHVTI